MKNIFNDNINRSFTVIITKLCIRRIKRKENLKLSYTSVQSTNFCGHPLQVALGYTLQTTVLETNARNSGTPNVHTQVKFSVALPGPSLHYTKRSANLIHLRHFFPTGNVAVLGVLSIFRKLRAKNSFLFVHGINPVISYVTM